MGALCLENFEDVPGAARTEVETQNTLASEAGRISGFEKGYQAGWDDALQTMEASAERLDAELGRNLEELSFSYFEAQRHVSLSLQALVETLVGKVLPELLQDSIGHLVTDVIDPLISDTANLTADLICSPSDLDVVASTIERHAAFPLTIKSETSFAKHQVRLQLGHEVHEIDGEQLLTDIRAAVDAHFSQLQDATAHAS